MNSATSAKRPRRWYQFSLRTMLIVITIASVGFGWLGLRMRQAQGQREAIRAIRRKGGEALYSYQIGERFGPQGDSPTPAWLRNLLGDDFFAKVTNVNLYGPYGGGFANADLAYLERFPELEGLVIDSMSVTDEGLVHLQGLTKLQHLSITASFTYAGLEHLRGLKQLRTLHVAGIGISDKACRRLQEDLPELKVTW